MSVLLMNLKMGRVHLPQRNHELQIAPSWARFSSGTCERAKLGPQRLDLAPNPQVRVSVSACLRASCQAGFFCASAGVHLGCVCVYIYIYMYIHNTITKHIFCIYVYTRIYGTN